MYFQQLSESVHDAILQWAYGVNQTLEQGNSPDDGYKITQNIINMTFEGIDGPVSINELGDSVVSQGYVHSYPQWLFLNMNTVIFHQQSSGNRASIYINSLSKL